jgi:(1->4)-alpha-D-glucan 1-alpha-D-glucosylmutase
VDEAGMEGPLADALLLRERGHDEFVTRFQQTSPPVTAKGVEDTAFYRYNRLLALNEVGGDPSRFGMSVADFHAGNVERARRFPRGLLITQTHDTKRSGDVRARIGALAGMAAEWRDHVLRWRATAAPLRERGAPDVNEEYLIYQTLVGAWPIDAARLEGYLEKALREAKRNTSWVEQDHDWEGRVKRFATALLDHHPFLEQFEPFAARVAEAGRRSALGQQLLKLTVPGVPDVYQGDELEALNLVDPDNRRPVDWDARRRALDALRGGAPPTAETLKLFVIWRALDLRARRAGAFDEGDYEPLDAGPDTCAFVRGGQVLVVVPVREDGGAVVRAPGRWRDVLTGARHDLRAQTPVAELVAPYGVALFEPG